MRCQGLSIDEGQARRDYHQNSCVSSSSMKKTSAPYCRIPQPTDLRCDSRERVVSRFIKVPSRRWFELFYEEFVDGVLFLAVTSKPSVSLREKTIKTQSYLAWSTWLADGNNTWRIQAPRRRAFMNYGSRTPITEFSNPEKNTACLMSHFEAHLQFLVRCPRTIRMLGTQRLSCWDCATKHEC